MKAKCVWLDWAQVYYLVSLEVLRWRYARQEYGNGHTDFSSILCLNGDGIRFLGEAVDCHENVSSAVIPLS